jgi:hypothetical protein
MASYVKGKGASASQVCVDSLRGSSDNSAVDRREQTRTLEFRFWILFVTIAACSGQALCQDPHDYVPNLPYTAQVVQTYTETEPDGTRARRQKNLVKIRDSQGRTRIESCASHNLNDRCQPDVVNLYVPLRRQFVQLFPGQKTSSVMNWDVPVPRHGDPNDKNIERKSLPGRTIDGIYSEGTRVTFLIPQDDGGAAEAGCVEEAWVSPDMKIAVLTKYGGTCSDGGIAEVRELDCSEPEAALFEIPTDYKIVTETDRPLPGSPNAEQQPRQP